MDNLLWQHLVQVCKLQWRRTRAKRWGEKLRRHQAAPFVDQQVWDQLVSWQEVWRLWRQQLPGGCQLWFYGGFARGRLHPHSDLDLWVEAAHPEVHRRLLLGGQASQPLSPFFPSPRWTWLERRLCGPLLSPGPTLLDTYQQRLIELGALFHAGQLAQGPRLVVESHFWSEPWFRLFDTRRLRVARPLRFVNDEKPSQIVVD